MIDYRPGDSPVHNLNPVTKLAVAAGLTVIVFLLPNLWGPVLLDVGPVTFWEEGVSYGLLVFFRVLAVVCAVFILVFSTYPKAMMVAFIDKGLSPKLAYVFMASLQFVPEMQRRGRALIKNQQARGLDLKGNLLRRFQALFGLIV